MKACKYVIRHESGRYYNRVMGPDLENKDQAGLYYDRDTAERCAAILCEAGRGRYYAEPLHTLTIHAGGAIEGGGFAVYGPDRALVRQMHDRTLVLVARDGSSTFLELPLPAPRYALACDAPGTGVPDRGAFERDFLAAVHVTRHHR